ncbi:HAMP domain-containing protein [Thiohalocapsa marina]|uniref:histidine kinase n=1 Tax=Thiohalocapsa marina TaxID=424902 RepID=A0A5M8FN80_9GAMM|nr:ATP-binding protein [Thiohalocapsa marina]KAA6183875.1 HAMP domain-containing protein [Thiohalocapsa marina]
MSRLRQRVKHPGAIGVGLLLLALLVALHLMSNAVQNSDTLSRAFVPLLSVVLVGLLVLVLIVGFNVVSLVLRYRRQATGSRLTARIVLLFSLSALLPLGVVYYYSLGFLLRGIDSWFDVEIDSAMQDALTLNQASLDLNQRVLMKYSAQILAGVEDRSATALTLTLDDLRRQAGALELTVYEPGGQVLGTAIDDPTQLVPNHPEREIMQGVRMGVDHVGLETSEDGELIVRVLVNDPRGRPLLMQAIFPTSARITELATRLETAYNRYTELSYLRRSLKFSFSLTLSLLLVFALMAALLAAFATAQRLAAPVANIARGTRSVAAGNYEEQLPLPAHDDELAFLVGSFNAMTRRIAKARDQLERSQRAVEEQRAYLETVLGRLSSGVVAFDTSLRLGTMNHAARDILRLTEAPSTELSLDRLESAHPRLTHWGETVRRHIGSGQAWREEVTLFGNEGRQVLMCRGSPLPSADGDPVGHVVVFDDITTLIRAQRDAAWGEVARRLAHEIKNPLTPIQLSAERLRHKLLKKVPEDDARVVDRATHTIVQQVEAMKAMVNDFANYARSPQMQAEPFALDDLVAEVLELYRAGPNRLTVELDTGGALISGDPKRLRQVLHNLLKNASEALEGGTDGAIGVRTRRLPDDESPALELVIDDNGGGIAPELMDRLFEPYVTSKSRGTGLGLAIVKKIIEEHGGIIRVENADHGARFTATLPVWRADSSASATPIRPAGES